MNVAHLFVDHARVRPDAAAVIHGHGGRARTIDFGSLDTRVGRAAALFTEAGFAAGDTIAVLCPMSIDLLVAMQAILRCGLTAMFLDVSARREDVERHLLVCPPAGMIGTPRACLLGLMSPALSEVRRRICVGGWVPGTTAWSRARRRAPRHDVADVPANAPALVTVTSGSTGRAKVLVRTHGFLRTQIRVLNDNFAQSPDTVDLAALPMFALLDLASGVTVVVPDADLRRPEAVDACRLWRQIAHVRPGRITASPALLERIAVFGERRRLALDSVHSICTGGGPVSMELLERLQALAPGAQVHAVYGSSEAEPVARVSAAEIMASDRDAMRGGAGLLAGHPVGAAAVQILQDRWGERLRDFDAASFDRACLQPNRAGEIVVSGPHVLPGYLDGVGDAETKFRVEGTVWHRTGDAGYLDHRGRLWLLGRCSARIHDVAGTLYPLGVESVACSFPAVSRAAVVSWRGRRLMLVSSKRTLSVRERREILRVLERFGIRELYVVPRIPVDRRHNAKLDYEELRRVLPWLALGACR